MATAAVPGLEVRAAAPHTRRSGGGYDAVLLHTTDGRHLLIRVPRSQAAETEQSADLVAIRSITTGIRSRLPFDVPAFVGQTPIDGTRAIVTEFVPGAVRTPDELTAESRLAESVGLAIAAIHMLPAGFVADAGLPRATAADCRDDVVALIGRAADTGRLPAALVRRWEQAADDAALWRFEPTVVNGLLTADSILVDGDHVSGVVGWSALAVGDPARDLHWLLTSRGEAAERALEAYLVARQGAADEHLARRALLYGELELARWLLHGVDSHDADIVADAVSLLDGLVQRVHDHSSEPLGVETGPIMTVGEVERMLDDTPREHRQREAGDAFLTDSYDFSELRRDGLAGDEPADLTAPLPLDLSDWGDADPAATQPIDVLDAAEAAEASAGAGAGEASAAQSDAADAASADAQAPRNAASS
ncbi:phosphotransferase [Agromyces protaetiae]|uniref:phosphotransferase n=1 Tax=Agromyces protaetiae TaxID=2509455 RepID=UPI001AA032CA|nr:phosphotransferase [Agromyces protaetiae]